MIVHEAIGMYEKMITFGDLTENGKKIIEIIFVEKDISFGISPGYNTIDCSGKLDT
jgi:hypothetical protein